MNLRCAEILKLSGVVGCTIKALCHIIDVGKKQHLWGWVLLARHSLMSLGLLIFIFLVSCVTFYGHLGPHWQTLNYRSCRSFQQLKETVSLVFRYIQIIFLMVIWCKGNNFLTFSWHSCRKIMFLTLYNLAIFMRMYLEDNLISC